jgi:hypothetical protein
MIYGIHVRGSPIDDRETQGSSEVVTNLRCECVSRTAALERDTVNVNVQDRRQSGGGKKPSVDPMSP